MAGVAVVDIKVKVTGIGDDVVANSSATMTVPTEVQKGYTVLATATTTAVQLFDAIDHIALAKIYGVFIKAVVGTIYIAVDTAGTATLTAATADFVLNVGESCYLPINPAGNLGLTVDASAVTGAIEWMVLGKA